MADRSSKSAAKRLLKELEDWQTEQHEENFIERLGPPDDGDILKWEAVINGACIGAGYDST
jgi:peroxin-4